MLFRSATLIQTLFVAGVLAFSSTVASAAIEDDVRAVFDNFVKAQNSHNIDRVRELLLDSPNFLWVTRGAPVWGREAALKRFESLYQGTWKLSPDMPNLKTVLVSETTAQLYVPITFNIGAPGQPAPDTSFLMNQTIVKTSAAGGSPTSCRYRSRHPLPRRQRDSPPCTQQGKSSGTSAKARTEGLNSGNQSFALGR